MNSLTKYTSSNTSKKQRKNLISSDLMVAMINLAGRQRMLSQRIALNVALAANGVARSIENAKEALALFKQTHTILVQGNHEYPGIFFEALEKAYFGPNEHALKIQQFIEACDKAIASCETNNQQLSSIVNHLGQEANAIVAPLNLITLTYEMESKRMVAARHKQQANLMTNIQKIAKEAKIVSFNAQVIAARSGEAGKEFAVVAGVMTNITEEIDALALAALTND